MADTATITPHVTRFGRSMGINGNVVCDEDVIIEGSFKGKLDVKDNTIIIGKDAVVEAELRAKIIQIIGKQTGDVHARIRVDVTSTGSVVGDAYAENINLQDGCNFKGIINLNR